MLEQIRLKYANYLGSTEHVVSFGYFASEAIRELLFASYGNYKTNSKFQFSRIKTCFLELKSEIKCGIHRIPRYVRVKQQIIN